MKENQFLPNEKKLCPVKVLVNREKEILLNNCEDLNCLDAKDKVCIKLEIRRNILLM